jgi:SAM-dependent methyltransferase
MAGTGDAATRPDLDDGAMTDTDDRPGLWARCGALLYDPFLALGERRGMADRRRALLAGAEGRVLELGAGTGLNVPHYPAAVRELVLSEPEPAMRAALERRVARAGHAAQVGPAPAEALPFADDSFDTVVSTMVLCTVHDLAAAIAETQRVLRPGGRLLFIEHGSPAGRIASRHRGRRSRRAAAATGRSTPCSRTRCPWSGPSARSGTGCRRWCAPSSSAPLRSGPRASRRRPPPFATAARAWCGCSPRAGGRCAG